MADRTKDQILDQAVYAIASLHRHYGPGLTAEGLQHVRKLLSEIGFCTDSCYRVDVYDDDPLADFYQRIVQPGGWDNLDYDDTIARSMPGYEGY
jgi:hypothetical protein